MTTPAMGKPTLVHLNNSASQRVLWLLEELGVEYDLEPHKRVKGRAPPELQKTHPLGKSPQLLLADGRVLIESSNILRYLIDTYDADNKFKGDGRKNDAIRDEELSDLVSSSMNGMADLGVIVCSEWAHTKSWRWWRDDGGTKPRASVCPSVPDADWCKAPTILTIKKFNCNPILIRLPALRGAFFDAQVDRQLEYVETQLSGQDYLMGASPGRPDFLLSFVYDNLEQRRMIKQPDKYPSIRAWNQRCKARPAWQRSLEKGNGYDVSSFE